MENIQLDHSHHQAKTQQRYSVCLLAHDIDVPMNIGSLFRIADALGIEKLYLTGTSSVPPNDKIKKTSRSAEKYVPYTYENNPLDVINQLRSLGYRIISLEITTASVDIRNLSVLADDRVCLIVGSENAGVSQQLLDASDQTIHIPMLGVNSSMNLATACSIAAFEIIRNYLP
jgi:tRNA G18 (ribose-2'-O)-methylase SpoU